MPSARGCGTSGWAQNGSSRSGRAVPGILPEGVNILAGRPKMGKSWAALNIAVAVASGGRALGASQQTQSL
jgi:RecA-family ATPase